MLFGELRNLLKQLMDETKCPNCDKSYSEQNIRIIGALKDEVFMHVSCDHCNSSVLVNAVINRYKDLRKHQGLKIRNLGAEISPITSNEIIEMHQFLENFDGDFKNLFSI